jgi:hypothetical protein
VTCKHEEAYLKVEECGYVTLLCDCSTPLAEFTEKCVCKEKPTKKFLAFGEITEEQARAVALAIRESNK